jgi:hypothetical protein
MMKMPIAASKTIGIFFGKVSKSRLSQHARKSFLIRSDSDAEHSPAVFNLWAKERRPSPNENPPPAVSVGVKNRNSKISRPFAGSR